MPSLTINVNPVLVAPNESKPQTNEELNAAFAALEQKMSMEEARLLLMQCNGKMDLLALGGPMVKELPEEQREVLRNYALWYRDNCKANLPQSEVIDSILLNTEKK